MFFDSWLLEPTADQPGSSSELVVRRTRKTLAETSVPVRSKSMQIKIGSTIARQHQQCQDGQKIPTQICAPSRVLVW